MRSNAPPTATRGRQLGRGWIQQLPAPPPPLACTPRRARGLLLPQTPTHTPRSPADSRPTREPLPTWGPLPAYSHLWGRCAETEAWTPGPPPVDAESRASVSQKRDRTRPKRESQQERLRGKEPETERTKERERIRNTETGPGKWGRREGGTERQRGREAGGGGVDDRGQERSKGRSGRGTR